MTEGYTRRALTKDSRKMERHGRVFDKSELKEGIIGKTYRALNMWIAVMLEARHNLRVNGGSDLILPLELDRMINMQQGRSDCMLDLLELTMLVQDGAMTMLVQDGDEGKEKIVIYKLNEVKKRIIALSDIHGDDTLEKFWTKYARLYGDLKPNPVDLFKSTLEKLENFND